MLGVVVVHIPPLLYQRINTLILYYSKLTIVGIVLFLSVICIVWGLDGAGQCGWGWGVLCCSQLSNVRPASSTVRPLALAVPCSRSLRLGVQPCSSSPKMFHAAAQPKIVQLSSQKKMTLVSKANVFVSNIRSILNKQK